MPTPTPTRQQYDLAKQFVGTPEFQQLDPGKQADIQNLITGFERGGQGVGASAPKSAIPPDTWRSRMSSLVLNAPPPPEKVPYSVDQPMLQPKPLATPPEATTGGFWDQAWELGTHPLRTAQDALVNLPGNLAKAGAHKVIDPALKTELGRDVGQFTLRSLDNILLGPAKAAIPLAKKGAERLGTALEGPVQAYGVMADPLNLHETFPEHLKKTVAPEVQRMLQAAEQDKPWSVASHMLGMGVAPLLGNQEPQIIEDVGNPETRGVALATLGADVGQFLAAPELPKWLRYTLGGPQTLADTVMTRTVGTAAGASMREAKLLNGETVLIPAHEVKGATAKITQAQEELAQIPATDPLARAAKESEIDALRSQIPSVHSQSFAQRALARALVNPIYGKWLQNIIDKNQTALAGLQKYLLPVGKSTTSTGLDALNAIKTGLKTERNKYGVMFDKLNTSPATVETQPFIDQWEAIKDDIGPLPNEGKIERSVDQNLYHDVSRPVLDAKGNPIKNKKTGVVEMETVREPKEELTVKEAREFLTGLGDMFPRTIRSYGSTSRQFHALQALMGEVRDTIRGSLTKPEQVMFDEAYSGYRDWVTTNEILADSKLHPQDYVINNVAVGQEQLVPRVLAEGTTEEATARLRSTMKSGAAHDLAAAAINEELLNQIRKPGVSLGGNITRDPTKIMQSGSHYDAAQIAQLVNRLDSNGRLERFLGAGEAKTLREFATLTADLTPTAAAVFNTGVMSSAKQIAYFVKDLPVTWILLNPKAGQFLKRAVQAANSNQYKAMRAHLAAMEKLAAAEGAKDKSKTLPPPMTLEERLQQGAVEGGNP